MSETTRVPTKDDKELAKAIFTAAAATPVAGASTADFEQMAEYALSAAMSFADALDKKPRSKGFLDI